MLASSRVTPYQPVQSPSPYPACSGHCRSRTAGSSVLQDSAARALWLLIKSDKKCLAREEGLLGCEPLQLAGQLIALIETAEAEEVRPS